MKNFVTPDPFNIDVYENPLTKILKDVVLW
jgi:hypothetical protein